jgi:hypothetical protein
VTWQSSNSAHVAAPACPLKVISYVCDGTGVRYLRLLFSGAVSLPGGRAGVISLSGMSCTVTGRRLALDDLLSNRSEHRLASGRVTK